MAFMEKVAASIVVYKTDVKILQRAVESFQSSTLTGKLSIIDNSPTDTLRESSVAWGAQYFFSSANIGYGKAHNIAMKESLTNTQYHLVLNPDVYFEKDTIQKLYWFMEEHPEAGLVMPRVKDPNGRLQMLCKQLPTPLNLTSRRFFPTAMWSKKLNDRYELKNSNYDHVMNVPFLSGCFMFLSTTALKQIGLFDERFFLYAEDTDLSRRIHQKFETLYFPWAEIFHVHERGSYKNFGLTLHNLKSAAQYFNKWGWFFDRERTIINQRAALNSYSLMASDNTLENVGMG